MWHIKDSALKQQLSIDFSACFPPSIWLDIGVKKEEKKKNSWKGDKKKRGKLCFTGVSFDV